MLIPFPGKTGLEDPGNQLLRVVLMTSEECVSILADPARPLIFGRENRDFLFPLLVGLFQCSDVISDFFFKLLM